MNPADASQIEQLLRMGIQGRRRAIDDFIDRVIEENDPEWLHHHLQLVLESGRWHGTRAQLERNDCEPSQGDQGTVQGDLPADPHARTAPGRNHGVLPDPGERARKPTRPRQFAACGRATTSAHRPRCGPSASLRRSGSAGHRSGLCGPQVLRTSSKEQDMLAGQAIELADQL
jgi:hypothetical protein